MHRKYVPPLVVFLHFFTFHYYVIYASYKTGWNWGLTGKFVDDHVWSAAWLQPCTSNSMKLVNRYFIDTDSGLCLTNFYCVVLKSFRWRTAVHMEEFQTPLLCCLYFDCLSLSVLLAECVCSVIFSAECCSFRKNLASPDISWKNGSASRISLKNPSEGSMCDRCLLYPHSSLCLFEAVVNEFKLEYISYVECWKFV